jgi:prepilin-type N-terminal cleavage/methylation domain-containing protein
MKRKNKKQKGFTLIELLVVISIITLLSSIIFTSVVNVRMKARNSKRVSDLRSVQTALEAYFSDNSGYPNTGGSGSFRGECLGYGSYASNLVIPGLVPNYLPKFPSDPSMKASLDQACYLFASDGRDYALLDFAIAPAELNVFDYKAYPVFVDPTRDGGGDPCSVDSTNIYSWKVFSSGAKCW